MFPRKLRNFNAFLDGASFAGKVASATLPTLATKNSEYRGGGMDGAIDVDTGLEKMTGKLELTELNPVIWQGFGQRKLIVLRAADLGENDFNAAAHVFTMGGRWNKISAGDFKPGDDVNLTLEYTLDYFKVEVEGTKLVEIGLENMIRVIGGVDQMASTRTALGM